MREVLQSRMSRLSIVLAITLASACGDPEDGNESGDLMESGDPAQNSDGSVPDAGTLVNPALPDASGVSSFDAGVSTKDAGTIGDRSDAGNIGPTSDAGRARSDAGGAASDAGAKADASVGVGLCSTLTYASFGMQFMTTYCASCHTGATAQHGVQLDTLAGVQRNKAAVKRQAVTGMTMPTPTQNPQPSAAERQKLGQWLDCGPN